MTCRECTGSSDWIVVGLTDEPVNGEPYYTMMTHKLFCWTGAKEYISHLPESRKAIAVEIDPLRLFRRKQQ